MKMSGNGLALVKAFEGCHKAIKGRPGKFAAYLDPVNVLTIGYGHTNHHPPGFDATTVWTQAECDAVLATDMGTFERHVEKLAKVELKQHEFDALTSWAFNTGGPATASLWKKLNVDDRAAVPDELKKWVTAKGKVLPGLVRRRRAEAEMFKGNVAEALKIAGAVRVAPHPPAVPGKTTIATATVTAGAAATAAGFSWAAIVIFMVAALALGIAAAVFISKKRKD